MNACFVPRRRWRALSAVVIAAFSLAGCTATTGTGGSLAGLAGNTPTPEIQKPAPPAAIYSVELRPAKGKPEIKQLPLHGPTLVQQALNQSGAAKRFHRMNAYLMRSSGDERHKMEVKFARKSRTVNPLYDYALAPGDHLVVSEDSATALDDMLNSVASPLGLSPRK